MAAARPILEVEDLSVDIPVPAGMLHPVQAVGFRVERGRTLAIVGESGCGKSLTSLALMNLLPPRAARSAGRLTLDGEDLLGLSERQMSNIRGNRMSMIFQEPMTSLNPAYTVGDQLVEAVRRHRRTSAGAARERAVWLLEKVGITGAEGRLRQYPHQLSGGLRQRVMIAMALMCEPDLIIADEPTTALDVTIQAQILHLLADLQREFETGLILITHDLGVVARLCDRVAVMYAGQIVEEGTARQIFETPAHPYTRGLLQCIPIPGRTRRGAHLGTIPGIVPSLVGAMPGCHFADRCPLVGEACRARPIAFREAAEAGHRYRCILPPGSARFSNPEPEPGSRPESEPRPGTGASPMSGAALVEAREVSCTFMVSGGFMKQKRRLPAVSRVSLRIDAGEVMALVGESGCGKTTLAKMLMGLIAPSEGTIEIDGRPIASLGRMEIARSVQPIFQDPYSSLNPRRSVGSIVTQPLRVQRDPDPGTWRRRAEEMMELVGLPRRLFNHYPGQLSGGQRQRVAIARALVNRPRMVICDEPTSALDVSVQSQILNLMQDLRSELGLTYLLISHNLAAVEHMASRVAVMYLGRIVEEAETGSLFDSPRHPYSQALLESVLTPDPTLGIPDTHLGASYPNPLDVPPGCSFHPRCAKSMAGCAVREPRRVPIPGGGAVACHLHDEGAEAGPTA